MEEAVLIRQLTQGNPEAFRQLYKQYHAKVFAFVIGLLKSESDTEDVMQEIFAKVWTVRNTLDKVNDLDAYLFILTKNQTLNFIKSKISREEMLNDHPFEELDPCSPHEELVAKDLLLLIDMVVEQMPPQRRLIYELSRKAGMTNDQIAEKLNLNKKTVENHINLALKTLRKIIMQLSWLICGVFHWG
ncbi:MAG: RNA polymerase sigma-70 factor [Parabacteroides sp.]